MPGSWACVPPDGSYCPGHDSKFCEKGFTCVHDTYCAPPGAVQCDGVQPSQEPFCLCERLPLAEPASPLLVRDGPALRVQMAQRA